ncbi:hypothetical protein PFICI_06298 [Pestalotiopsis fici W106-1]|uniref:Uncharacterized protein n=1 Tax=Pestalotiopsis fici (strain W106-1 / CGMCC3.15140) TaxID=1229662 RepID=W3X803_PESFW|nr:uncharacterized protein PFICI_06298 [Pestalotiopsis fici W106-1]ETS81296.1 hypothetical protein PFICI_06298 [Pestalotiopsis fici W106-1]
MYVLGLGRWNKRFQKALQDNGLMWHTTPSGAGIRSGIDPRGNFANFVVSDDEAESEEELDSREEHVEEESSSSEESDVSEFSGDSDDDNADRDDVEDDMTGGNEDGVGCLPWLFSDEHSEEDSDRDGENPDHNGEGAVRNDPEAVETLIHQRFNDFIFERIIADAVSQLAARVNTTLTNAVAYQVEPPAGDENEGWVKLYSKLDDNSRRAAMRGNGNTQLFGNQGGGNKENGNQNSDSSDPDPMEIDKINAVMQQAGYPKLTQS